MKKHQYLSIVSPLIATLLRTLRRRNSVNLAADIETDAKVSSVSIGSFEIARSRIG